MVPQVLSSRTCRPQVTLRVTMQAAILPVKNSSCWGKPYVLLTVGDETLLKATPIFSCSGT